MSLLPLGCLYATDLNGLSYPPLGLIRIHWDTLFGRETDSKNCLTPKSEGAGVHCLNRLLCVQHFVRSGTHKVVNPASRSPPALKKIIFLFFIFINYIRFFMNASQSSSSPSGGLVREPGVPTQVQPSAPNSESSFDDSQCPEQRSGEYFDDSSDAEGMADSASEGVHVGYAGDSVVSSDEGELMSDASQFFDEKSVSVDLGAYRRALHKARDASAMDISSPSPIEPKHKKEKTPKQKRKEKQAKRKLEFPTPSPKKKKQKIIEVPQTQDLVPEPDPDAAEAPVLHEEAVDEPILPPGTTFNPISFLGLRPIHGSFSSSYAEYTNGFPRYWAVPSHYRAAKVPDYFEQRLGQGDWYHFCLDCEQLFTEEGFWFNHSCIKHEH